MPDCGQELCPIWDGDTCPCEAYRLDKDDQPSDGIFTIETRAAPMSELVKSRNPRARKTQWFNICQEEISGV